MSRLSAVLAAMIAIGATSAQAAAQLDLPSKPKLPPKPVKEEPRKGDNGTILGVKKSGSVASGNVGETTKKEVIYDEKGRAVATVSTVRENVPGQGRNGKGNVQLDLPKTGAQPGGGAARPVNEPKRQPWESAPVAQPIARPTGPAPGGARDGFDPLGEAGSSRSAARFLFDRLSKVRRISDVEVEEISDHLARLSEDGLRVARYCLAQDDDVLSYAGARTILIAGSAADADRVVLRLRGNVPPRVGQHILTELIDRDPVRASSAFLAQMLRHRSGSVRRVAEKELSKRINVDDLPLLVPALEDRSTDVRKAATSLLAGLGDSPLVTEYLMERVVDRSSSVSEIAIDAISRASAGDPSFELLRRVFESGEIVRHEALLIIAIVDREDRQAIPIFGEQHLVGLLRALDSPQPIVNAAAALALAGIGFRSEDEGKMPWLDGPVPSALVAVATGSTFFDGYSLVRDPALRRLRLISGVNHGSNGPDWSEWWGNEKYRFRADRAVIHVGAEDVSRIVLRVDPGIAAVSPALLRLGQGRPFVLVGRALSEDPEWIAAEHERAGSMGVDILFLTDGDAADLMSLLSEEGVFGSGRLPGPRGSFGAGGRSIEVQVGRRAKSFRFSQLQTQPWFDRIMARGEGLADHYAWERFPVAGVHADSTDLFLTEAPWWSEPHTDEEKSNRFLGLLVDHLEAAPIKEREPGIAELELLVASRATGDFPEGTLPRLTGLLREETVFGNRARQLTDTVSRMVELDPESPLHGAQRTQLLVVLHDQFGPLALSSIATVLQRAGHGAVLEAAVDERETLRVAAALNLGQADAAENPEDIDLLLLMLGDEAEDVEIAALAALAMRKAEGARVAVWARARVSSSNGVSVSTRAAALRAAGMIGGSGALELLIAGLTDSDERFHLPAAEGLASLGTPETAALLVSLLRGNQRQSVQTVAKEGLLRLGEAGHDDLFAAMRSPDKGLQRDAAVLLARQLIPRSVPVLASTVALDPDDATAMHELAVLTCVDFSGEALPAERYFQWWDEVDHNNAFSWFAAALELRGVRAPEAMAFEGGGTEEARLFLLTMVREVGGFLGERALRELERLHGESLGPVPLRISQRDDWFIKVRGLVLPDELESGFRSGSGDERR
ncbi:MAG: HEAT repeat protein [Planctomycetota bacterium]|jgi:HEAT repeat protein